MKKIALTILTAIIILGVLIGLPFTIQAQDKKDDIFDAIKKELTRDNDFYSADSVSKNGQQKIVSDSLSLKELKAQKKEERAIRKAEKAKARAEAKAAKFAEQQRLLEERQRAGAQKVAEQKAQQQSKTNLNEKIKKPIKSQNSATQSKADTQTVKPKKERPTKPKKEKPEKPKKVKVEKTKPKPANNIPLTEEEKKLVEKKAFIEALQKRNADKAAKRQAAIDKATGTVKQPSKKAKVKKNNSTPPTQAKPKPEKKPKPAKEKAIKKPKLKDPSKGNKAQSTKNKILKNKKPKTDKQKNTGSITIPKKQKTKEQKEKQSIIDKIVDTSDNAPEPATLDENGNPVKITVDDRLENPELSEEQRQRLLLKKQNQVAREAAKAERKEAAQNRKKLRKEMRAVQAKVDSVNRIKFTKEKETRLKERLATMTPEETERYNQRQKNKIVKAQIDSVKRANRQTERNYLKNRRNSITYYDKEGKLNPVIDTVLIVSDGFASLNEQDKQKYKFNFNRGLMKVTLEDHREALKYFQKCLDLTPYNEEVLQLRGNTYVELNKFKQAKRDFEFALTKKSGDPVLYYNYAITNAKLGDFGDAIAAFDQAIDLDPDYMLAYQGRAVAKTMSGDFDGSLEDYNRAIEQNAYFTSAYKGRGVSKCLMGEYQAAIYDFTMVLEFKPDDALSYYYRGLAYHGLDNFFKGCTDLSRADDMGIFAAGMQMKSLCK